MRLIVQNSLAAIAVGLELRISEEDMKIALGSFMGVKRRFTKVACIDEITIIDDYAHDPVEILAVLKTVRSVCKGKIVAVIQPHRYSRLKNFLPEFVKCLELSDYCFVVPIYSAGERSNGIDHFSLLKALNKGGKVIADFSQDVKTLKSKISGVLAPGDFVVFLGAGDITRWAYQLADLMRE